MLSGTVFQTALFSLVINPETSSRVTLALLGIVFQTKLFTTDTHLCFTHFYQLLIHIIYTDAHFLLLVITIERVNKIWLEANTERSESNPGRSLGVLRLHRSSCLEDSTLLTSSLAFGSLAMFKIYHG